MTGLYFQDPEYKSNVSGITISGHKTTSTETIHQVQKFCDAFILIPDGRAFILSIRAPKKNYSLTVALFHSIGGDTHRFCLTPEKGNIFFAYNSNLLDLENIVIVDPETCRFHFDGFREFYHDVKLR